MSLIRLSLSTPQIQLKITHETQLMLFYGGVCMLYKWNSPLLMMNIATCFGHSIQACMALVDLLLACTSVKYYGPQTTNIHQQAHDSPCQVSSTLIINR